MRKVLTLEETLMSDKVTNFERNILLMSDKVTELTVFEELSIL